MDAGRGKILRFLVFDSSVRLVRGSFILPFLWSGNVSTVGWLFLDEDTPSVFMRSLPS